jgi:hypothetical protein
MTYQITTLTDIIEYYKPIADKIEKVFAETEPEGFFSHAELRAATLGALAKKFLGEFVDCREGDDPRVDWKATHERLSQIDNRIAIRAMKEFFAFHDEGASDAELLRSGFPEYPVVYKDEKND